MAKNMFQTGPAPSTNFPAGRIAAEIPNYGRDSFAEVYAPRVGPPPEESLAERAINIRARLAEQDAASSKAWRKLSKVQRSNRVRAELEDARESLDRARAEIEAREAELAASPERPSTSWKMRELLALGAMGQDVEGELADLEEKTREFDEVSAPRRLKLEQTIEGLRILEGQFSERVAELAEEFPFRRAEALDEIAAGVAERYQCASAELMEIAGALFALQREQPLVTKHGTVADYFVADVHNLYVPAPDPRLVAVPAPGWRRDDIAGTFSGKRFTEIARSMLEAAGLQD